MTHKDIPEAARNAIVDTLFEMLAEFEEQGDFLHLATTPEAVTRMVGEARYRQGRIDSIRELSRRSRERLMLEEQRREAR